MINVFEKIETLAQQPKQPAPLVPDPSPYKNRPMLDRLPLEPPKPRTESGFLPDFCANQVVFGMVLLGELFALILALTEIDNLTAFWNQLALVSLFVQWVALTAAAALCLCVSLIHISGSGRIEWSCPANQPREAGLWRRRDCCYRCKAALGLAEDWRVTSSK